jgi:X-Pro dipeptidyl-peptidase C-terminal non-catalytic domain
MPAYTISTWIVIIRNRAPDGSQPVVTKGWLRASHRAVDPAKSTPVDSAQSSSFARSFSSSANSLTSD